MNMLPSHHAHGNMPLHCNICPKRPDFSDVSHLLTHIASKGHLSNYFKVKVKSPGDLAAQQRLAEYDRWYQEWNVDNLMRERMSQKEKKQAGSNPHRPKRSNGGEARHAPALESLLTRNEPPVRSNPSRSTPAAAMSTARASRLRDSVLDPQLGRRIKQEPLSRSATPGLVYPLDPAGLPPPYAPPMHPVLRTPFDFAEPYFKQESLGSSFSNVESDDLYLNPHHAQLYLHHRLPSDSLISLVEGEYDMDETVTDHNKLKGVYWPGMAMFDSATPEMRRKRNQKKNVSVLRQLQATSEVVTPTESVFDAEGALRKQRVITGNPESSDSLIEGESEPEPAIPEKQRARRSRPRNALAERNPNNNRMTRPRGEPRRSLLSRNNGPYYIDDDDDLTYETSRPKKRRTGLSIHRDNSGPEITFDNPAPFNLLTTGFRPPMQPGIHSNNPLQPQQRHFHSQPEPRSRRRQPSWGSFGTSFRPSSFSQGLPSQSFASFGHYLNQSVAQQPAHQTHPAGLQPFQSIDHRLNPAGTSFPTESPMLHMHNDSAWDAFGLSPPELGFPNPADPAASQPNDATTTNPLFFSSIQVDREDDEGTLSATSEH